MDTLPCTREPQTVSRYNYSKTLPVQIRGGIEDNSFFFLFLNENICCDPSLERLVCPGCSVPLIEVVTIYCYVLFQNDILSKLRSDVFPKFIGILEKILRENSSNSGYMVGDSVSMHFFLHSFFTS